MLGEFNSPKYLLYQIGRDSFSLREMDENIKKETNSTILNLYLFKH